MAEYVGFSISFDAPFEPAVVRTFFTTLRSAVVENWVDHRDALSWPGSGDEDIDVDALLAETLPEKMKPSIGDEERLITEGWITFAFGPVSTYCGLLTVGRGRDGKLFAHLSVCDSEMGRDDRDRLQLRQECEAEFKDPRFLPEPTFDAEDRDAVLENIDRLEEVWRENERRHNIYYRDREAVWAVSAACLRHIFERLAVALPVRESRMDDELSPRGASLAIQSRHDGSIIE